VAPLLHDHCMHQCFPVEQTWLTLRRAMRASKVAVLRFTFTRSGTTTICKRASPLTRFWSITDLKVMPLLLRSHSTPTKILNHKPPTPPSGWCLHLDSAVGRCWRPSVLASYLVVLNGYWVNKVILRTAWICGCSYLPFVCALHARFSHHL
jgi:hypothetical protein